MVLLGVCSALEFILDTVQNDKETRQQAQESLRRGRVGEHHRQSIGKFPQNLAVDDLKGGRASYPEVRTTLISGA